MISAAFCVRTTKFYRTNLKHFTLSASMLVSLFFLTFFLLKLNICTKFRCEINYSFIYSFFYCFYLINQIPRTSKPTIIHVQHEDAHYINSKNYFRFIFLQCFYFVFKWKLCISDQTLWKSCLLIVSKFIAFSIKKKSFNGHILCTIFSFYTVIDFNLIYKCCVCVCVHIRKNIHNILHVICLFIFTDFLLFCTIWIQYV